MLGLIYKELYDAMKMAPNIKYSIQETPSK